MDMIGQLALARQTGLDREMSVIANNLANMSTTGYRNEGVVFSESVQAAPPGGESVSMAALSARFDRDTSGALVATGGALDLAVQGRGYFQIEGSGGVRLTRAGAFTQDADGQVVTAQGEFLLDAAGTRILLPPGAGAPKIAADGTMTLDGEPIAAIGLFVPAEGASFERLDGVRFRSDAPFVPFDGGHVAQGFLEGSNTSPVVEMTRMIDVQRAYEFAQALQDREDERQRAVIRMLGQPAS